MAVAFALHILNYTPVKEKVIIRFDSNDDDTFENLRDKSAGRDVIL